MKKIQKAAYTLAEVTITLAILGVVAAITIRSGYNHAKEILYVVRAKDTYAMLEQATKMWMVENGCSDDISKCIRKAGTSPAAFDGIAQYLKVVDSTSFRQNNTTRKNGQIVYGAKTCRKNDCDNANNGKALTTRWLPAKTTLFDGTPQKYAWQGVSQAGGNASFNGAADEYGTTGFYLLKNGVTISAQAPDNCGVSGFGFFDVNGKKGPNRVGVDVFPFGLGMPYYTREKKTSNSERYGLYSKGLNPYYTEDNNGNKGGLCRTIDNNNCKGSENSPLEYVLLTGKLPPRVKH